METSDNALTDKPPFTKCTELIEFSLQEAAFTPVKPSEIPLTALPSTRERRELIKRESPKHLRTYS
jgi:hypothetical protein